MRSASVFSISGAGNSMARPHQSTGALFKRPSSASSSRSISCSIYSEDWPKTCFFSLAMRSRRVWINWSWAGRVAEIFVLSACKPMINAVRSAGSSGRVWAAFDMYLTATGQ